MLSRGSRREIRLRDGRLGASVEMLEGRLLLSGEQGLFVFYDDFDDGIADGWTALDAGGLLPTVVRSPEGFALRGSGHGDGTPFTERLLRRLPVANAVEISVEYRAKAGPGAGNVAEALILEGNSIDEGVHYWMWARGASSMTADWIVGDYGYVYNHDLGEMVHEWHDYRWSRDASGFWTFSIDGQIAATRFRRDLQISNFETLVLGVGRDESEIEWIRVTGRCDPPPPAVPVRMPGTDHYYLRIDTDWQTVAADWDDAEARAAAMMFEGMRGHLATITSVEENEFIRLNVLNYSLVGDRSSYYWIGGRQSADASEPSDGWLWSTGESWDFTNFGVPDPDNGTQWSGHDEDYLVICGPGENEFWGKWRDTFCPFTGSDGYVVEFEPVSENSILVNGQTLALTTSRQVETVEIRDGTLLVEPGGNKALLTRSLLIRDGGALDLNDNALIIKNTASDTIVSLVASGSNGGHWDGPGIRSATAGNVPGGFATLAVFLNNTGDGTRIVSSIGGMATEASDVIVMFTWNGDANVDGIVNADDYFLIDSGFITQNTGWYNGDFNHDGAVNADDYFLIDSAFIGQTGALGQSQATLCEGSLLFGLVLLKKTPASQGDSVPGGLLRDWSFVW